MTTSRSTYFESTPFPLSGCAVVGAAAGVTGAVISTTAEVTGDVIGAATRTVTGSGSKSDQDSK